MPAVIVVMLLLVYSYIHRRRYIRWLANLRVRGIPTPPLGDRGCRLCGICIYSSISKQPVMYILDDVRSNVGVNKYSSSGDGCLQGYTIMHGITYSATEFKVFHLCYYYLYNI